MIKILIADDHPIVRAGLSKILSRDPDIVVSAEAQDANEIRELVGEREFDLVILDISMPDKNGLEALEYLKGECPALKVLILSMHPEEQYAVQAFKTGADGYLTKQSAPEELVKAIRKIMSGGKYVSPKLAEILAFDLGKDPGKLLYQTLSNRELQVMRMIASGVAPKDIADKLCLSVKTVGTYRERILEKLQVKTNADIIRCAIENHLLD